MQASLCTVLCYIYRLSKYPVAAGPPHIIVDQVMMLIQSSLPSSIEAAFSFTSDHEEKELLCDWTSGAETWQECPRCDKHPNSGHERVVSFTKRKNDCCSCSLNCLSSSSQQSTVATMSENSTPTFVYQRRMLQKGNASVSPARSNCVSVISSEGPSVTAKDHVVSLVEVKTEVVRASVMLPAECNRGALVSKSASMGGCSLDDELGSVEGPKADMLKIVDICFVNDSCSSSKLNMDLCAATLKIEVDDTGECSSSNAFVMDLQDDISKKDACISILKGLGLHKGVWTINNRASPEGLGINCYCSCWRSCKVCDQSEITLKMLICDQCEEAFHVSCCYPRLKKIPHDEWFCHSCLKKGCKILESTSSSEMSRCRNATSKGVLGPIAVMLDDTEPYTTNVRIGREFQAEVPDWSGPIAIEVDNIGEPLEINPSEGVSFQERSSGKFYRLSSICNWLQCREVICGIGEGVNGTVCGKWRRAPLFEVQTDNWECFRSFLWDPTQADCAVPPELDTDQVVKELKYIEMLRPRLAGKKRKLGCEKSVDSNGPTEDVRNMDTL